MVEFELLDGVKVGERIEKAVTLRPLKAADIFAANEAAEVLKFAPLNGQLEPYLLRSPARATKESLRRNIAKLGEIDGPIGLEVLGQFSERDLDLLLEKVEQLDQGAGAGANRRGRDSEGKGAA